MRVTKPIRQLVINLLLVDLLTSLRLRAHSVCRCRPWTWLLLLEPRREWFGFSLALTLASTPAFAFSFFLSGYNPSSKHLHLQPVLALPLQVELFVDFAFACWRPPAHAITLRPSRKQRLPVVQNKTANSTYRKVSVDVLPGATTMASFTKPSTVKPAARAARCARRLAARMVPRRYAAPAGRARLTFDRRKAFNSQVYLSAARVDQV